jgi:hypothetical protein
MTADMVVSRQSVGSLNATRTFATDFGKFIAFAQAILCLPRERHPKRLLMLQVLLAIHVLACVSTFLASFFEVGFGSVGKSKVHGEDDVMVILTSFDFLSQAVALLTGLLCAWWFFCTRHLMEATLAERPQRKSHGSTAAHSGALVGFGYDFFLSYPGAPPSGAKASDAAAAVLPHGASGAATLGGGSRCDAGHEVEELFAALDECCRKSNARYPTGCFLDWKKIPEQLATLAGKSQAKEGPNCPPGPRTGFHIFLSYRRKNAADARALKQALSLKGYRIFMDLDRDGLGAGDFQAQLEQVFTQQRCEVYTHLPAFATCCRSVSQRRVGGANAARCARCERHGVGDACAACHRGEPGRRSWSFRKLPCAPLRRAVSLTAVS